MNKLHAVLATLVLAVLAAAPAAHAQATRTWVSGVGDDANPCSRTAPCKTFAGAISKTAAGGEISVLDPGGFGAVTITKSITINGDGTLAGILASLTNGVIVNAGVNDRVVLRNISINGAGNGLNGIRYLAGKSLTVDNVTISGFTTRGIDMSLAATGNLFVRGTRITNVPTGIRVSTTSGQAVATLDDVQLTGLTNGLEVAGNGFATISNSVLSGNSSNGVLASGANTEINVVSCQVDYNGVAALNASVSGSRIRFSLNQIYNNAASLIIAAGAIINSDGNNRVAGNTSQPAPNGGAIPIQ